ncbi:MAG: PBP1A family penicillin-binding protein [Acidobacteriota bacterium]|nr:PBP1A family penicillin-binding protein [Acidobacteriota bacterium]
MNPIVSPTRTYTIQSKSSSWGPRWRLAAMVGAGVLCLLLAVFIFFYFKYSSLIDRKFRSGSLQTVSEVFAAPRLVKVGEAVTAPELVAQLKRSGYAENVVHPQGQYILSAEGLRISPGTSSFFTQESVLVRFAKGRVAQIVSLADNRSKDQVLLEPELISNLTDKTRARRRLVRFAEIPPALLQAVTSVEDKRFFQHTGFDVLRIGKAAYVDIRQGRKGQGASTLSMQLARNVFLDNEKSWHRKASEAFLTFLLEARFSKEQLFEFYANEVYLGQKGTFNIHGFGEASRDYFGKDVSGLSIAEAALLAGVIQRPSYFNPFRWPDRALARRQIVLTLMQQNGHIDSTQFAEASAAPLRLAVRAGESSDAPYFLDFVNDAIPAQLQNKDDDLHTAHRIYTTLDLPLQREAASAIAAGMQLVDAQLRRSHRSEGSTAPKPQVALVALDPRTGAIKAMVGGRDYAQSQLDHVFSKRQPGSVFKPFVYAAALRPRADANGRPFVTPATLLQDQPTTFLFHNQPYNPGNFEHRFYGTVTVREALEHSLNVPAVKLAEMTGYDSVAMLARSAGLPLSIPTTPSVALGSYEATPLEVAGAYTVFSNYGTFAGPNWISRIVDRGGKVAFEDHPVKRSVLDPRVAYLMVNLMEGVLDNGTGAGVRARGFRLPAAGKTGTSRDGWFAGFTSKLLCVVWVGFDDNRELNLEGAKSALPIWTEFMRRAHQYPEYRDTQPFQEPAGMVHTRIDPVSGQLATAACPTVRAELFIAGTEPREVCSLHREDARRENPRPGFFRRLWGVFK